MGSALNTHEKAQALGLQMLHIPSREEGEGLTGPSLLVATGPPSYLRERKPQVLDSVAWLASSRLEICPNF